MRGVEKFPSEYSNISNSKKKILMEAYYQKPRTQRLAIMAANPNMIRALSPIRNEREGRFEHTQTALMRSHSPSKSDVNKVRLLLVLEIIYLFRN